MIRIHALAAEEITVAFAWYSERSMRAADNFSADLAEAFMKIQSRPLHYPCFIEDYRLFALRAFLIWLSFRLSLWVLFMFMHLLMQAANQDIGRSEVFKFPDEDLLPCQFIS